MLIKKFKYSVPVFFTTSSLQILQNVFGLFQGLLLHEVISKISIRNFNYERIGENKLLKSVIFI